MHHAVEFNFIIGELTPFITRNLLDCKIFAELITRLLFALITVAVVTVAVEVGVNICVDTGKYELLAANFELIICMLGKTLLLLLLITLDLDDSCFVAVSIMKS